MQEIPILSEEAIKVVDASLTDTKLWFPLSKSDFQVWKLLKKASALSWGEHMKKEDFQKLIVVFDTIQTKGFESGEFLYELNTAAQKYPLYAQN